MRSGALYVVLDATFFAWLGFELIRGIRARRRTRYDQDRSSAPLMFAGIFVGVNVAGRLADRQLWPLPGSRLSYVVAGLAVMWIGIGIRGWSFATLGNLFTYRVTIQPGHHLVSSGPYRYVRHPSYTGLVLFVVGDVLALRDGLALIVVIVAVAPVLAYRIHVEEKELTAALGEEYREYARTTKRLVPAIL